MGKRAVENGGKGETRRLRPTWQPVLAAILPPLAAFAFEHFYWSTITRWLLFNAAVIVSSWLGGLKSGIVATLLSTVLVWWFLVPPERAFSRTDTRHLVTAALFIAIGVTISIFHEQLRRANRRAELALERAEHANEALGRIAKERRIFAALIENAWDFIGIADATGRPLYVNPGGRRMVDLPPDFPIEDTKMTEYYTPDAGDVQVGDRVLIMTGRHTAYRTPQSHDRPYITEEAVRWLVEDRKINCLGTDSSGFEVRGVSHHPNHRLLNNAGVPVLECLTNLVELHKQRIYLIALPLPITRLDACPVRAIAIEPEA